MGLYMFFPKLYEFFQGHQKRDLAIAIHSFGIPIENLFYMGCLVFYIEEFIYLLLIFGKGISAFRMGYYVGKIRRNGIDV